MSEPWIPQPPAEDAAGPSAELYTLVYRSGHGVLRKVVVYARNRQEAAAQSVYERRTGERLIRVRQGGTLPAVRR